MRGFAFGFSGGEGRVVEGGGGGVKKRVVHGEVEGREAVRARISVRRLEDS